MDVEDSVADTKVRPKQARLVYSKVSENSWTAREQCSSETRGASEGQDVVGQDPRREKKSALWHKEVSLHKGQRCPRPRPNFLIPTT